MLWSTAQIVCALKNLLKKRKRKEIIRVHILQQWLMALKKMKRDLQLWFKGCCKGWPLDWCWVFLWSNKDEHQKVSEYCHLMSMMVFALYALVPMCRIKISKFSSMFVQLQARNHIHFPFIVPFFFIESWLCVFMSVSHAKKKKKININYIHTHISKKNKWGVHVMTKAKYSQVVIAHL